ncbi:hypothetical protein [Pleionea sp. CnH1-48]|uniref:hypothetical protein n=1 Tax=Pleionea sp. CnH1-48 TaxID=2954494 RepID=UPI00209703AA|nr:hypothetical protein [Pleionea sp. CnH1-48]MCO7225686.1 hypothetical protein [Pleionea sp. CnH1-48]
MRIIFVSIALFLSLPVFASSATGKIDWLIVRDSDGLTYFTLKNFSRDEKPACAKHDYWMIKDEKSVSGKHQLSILLAAQASGKTVTVRGYAACTRWGDGEDVNSIQIRSE